MGGWRLKEDVRFAGLAALYECRAISTIVKLMTMSKAKIAIVSAIAVAALAVAVVMQHQSIQQMRLDNEELRQQAAQLAPLQEKLAAAAQEAAKAGAASLSETQVRELARLRGEVSLLREQTNQLAKARQEIQRLNQRLASEEEAKRGAAAQFQALDLKTQRMNACINNLRIIDGAKQQWALEAHKQITDTPTWEDVRPYIGRGPNGELPVCPDGGAYTIGTIGEKPTCSNREHVLP
jgi:hypothetical protein